MRINKECRLIRRIILLFVLSDLLLFKEIQTSQILICQNFSIRVVFRSNSKSLIIFLLLFWISHSECRWEHLYNQTQQETQIAFLVYLIEICMEINSLLVKLKRSHKTKKIDISFLKKIKIMISKTSENTTWLWNV